MKIEQEDLIQKLDNLNEKYLIGNITKKFDKYDGERNSQLTDINSLEMQLIIRKFHDLTVGITRLNYRIFTNSLKL